MSVDHTSTIDANKDDILDVLRVSDLLLTELCGEDVLDERTKQMILSGGIQYEINERFLDWIKHSQPSTFTVCLEKLRDDQQNHIANLLDGTPGERPLAREKRKQIQKNIRHLSEIIDVDSGLLTLMCSKSALSLRENQEIYSEKVTEDKAMKLLQIILQKSDRTFNCFVEALRDTNQAHVISSLEKGNIIALHAEFRSASDLLDQFEEELVSILEPIAHQISYLDTELEPSEEVQMIQHELQDICNKRIKCLRLKKGKSITIYLLCEDVEAKAELLLMFETRQLERILEEVFNLVKTSFKIPNAMIRVTMAVNDLQILKEAVQLNELAGKKSHSAEDLYLESIELDELQPSKLRFKAKAKDDFRSHKIEPQMKHILHHVKEIEPGFEGAELQLNMQRVVLENIKLKEKLKAAEAENSKLKQQMQLMQDEHTILSKKLQSAIAARCQIQESYEEILKQIVQQQNALMTLENIDTENHVVFGVTYLRDDIYLLSNQRLLAYQRDSPYLRNIFDDIALPEIGGPVDIAACHRTSCLYISDQEKFCVWRILVDEQRIFKWLLEVGEPFSLSVTRDGRVLIPRSEPEPCLDVYNSRADLLCHFLLPCKSWQPLHAVETVNQSIILSFWSEDIMWKCRYGICELNSKGQAILRPLYKTVGLESPVYMAPGNDNWVFVARKDINSVTLFEKHFFCDVVDDDKYGIENPRKICYIRGKTDNRARLAILYGEKSEVVICTLPKVGVLF